MKRVGLNKTEVDHCAASWQIESDEHMRKEYECSQVRRETLVFFSWLLTARILQPFMERGLMKRAIVRAGALRNRCTKLE